MPYATHLVYIVCESDKIFHGVILLGKLRVIYETYHNVRICVRSCTAGTTGYELRDKRKINP